MLVKHKSLQPNQLSPKAKRIFLYLQNYSSSTRAEISSGTGLKLSTVCSSVDKLKKAGLIQVSGKVKDETSGVVVQKLSPVNAEASI